MFLNPVNYLWRDLGRASGRQVVLLVIGPLALMVLLVVPTVLSAPPVATHVELSGTGTRTGPEEHLGGSYQLTFSITGTAGCTYQLGIGGTGSGWGLGEYSFPSGSTQSREQVWRENVPDLTDGRYAISTVATGCGPWTVTLDRTPAAG